MRPCSRCLEVYTRHAVSSPWKLLLAWTLVPAVLVVVLIVAGGGLPALETDISSSDYLRSDGVVADRYDALQAAVAFEQHRAAQVQHYGADRRLSEQESAEEEAYGVREGPPPDGGPAQRGAAAQGGRRLGPLLEPQQGFGEWKVDLYFEATRGSLFDRAVLDDIRAFELRLAGLPSYSQLCLLQSGMDDSCRQPISAMRFFYGTKYAPDSPQRRQGDGQVNYYIDPDGQGPALNPWMAVLTAMAEQRSWPRLDAAVGRVWYFDPLFPHSRRMRSRFTFALPLDGYASRLDRYEEQRARYERFVAEELYPVLKRARSDNFKLYYEGDAVTQCEVRDVVITDSSLALASLAVVWLFMVAYFRGPVLATVGIAAVVLAVPLGIAIYVVTGHATLPLINVLAFFLLVGISADNVFILSDAWDLSAAESAELAERLQMTLVRAGKTVLACGSTTAVSFLANIWSSVRPLRWFGTFVGICVMCNVVLCLGVMPLVLVLRSGNYWWGFREGHARVSPVARRDAPAKPAPALAPAPAECEGGGEPWPRPEQPLPETPCSAASGAELLSFQDDPGAAGGGSWRGSCRRCVAYLRLLCPAGELYVLLLWRLRFALVLAGVGVTLAALVVAGLNLHVSRDPPRFFAPGVSNLGDVGEVRDSFGNGTAWVPEMEMEPLRICAGCAWLEGGDPLKPVGCRRLGAACTSLPCAAMSQVQADPSPCAGRGDCIAGTGRCLCDAAWTGPDCRLRAGPARTPDARAQDCRWGRWSEWSPCSFACGLGKSSRQRPLLANRQGAGPACPQLMQENQTCKQKECDLSCVWGAWSQWGACEVDCGTGLQRRQRQVQTLPRGQGEGCAGGSQEARSCLGPPCPPGCRASDWADAGPCSASCGDGGTVRQSRSVAQARCNASLALARDVPCGGAACPADCQYGPWEDAPGGCSADCGDGQLVQTRSLLVGSTATCPAAESRLAGCSALPCPWQAGSACPESRFGPWGDWTQCSAECGRGKRQRTRYAPGECGPGRTVQVEECTGAGCSSALCDAFAWVAVGPCSATCGAGLQPQRRAVDWNATLPLGCLAEREVPCEVPQACPVDCQLSVWAEVSACSATCGPGLVQQVRNVLQRGLYGGQPCPGESSSSRLRFVPCQVANCSDAGGQQAGPGPSPGPSLQQWPTRPAAVAAPPSGTGLPDRAVATVNVVFGLLPLTPEKRTGSLEEPRYDERFDLSRSGAQVAIDELCQEAADLAPVLAIRRARCFMTDFKAFLAAQVPVAGFPVAPTFSVPSLVGAFLADPVGQPWLQYIGFSEDGSRVAWVRVEFTTNLARQMPAADAWLWAKRWDAFVNEFNREQEASGIGQAFHTSDLWVRAETETKLVTATLACAGFSIAASFAMVLLFLAHIRLTMFVLVSVICVIACLAASTLGVLGWPFGAVEAVGLIVFVGFSVDYSLHFAESFNQSKEPTRQLKVHDAARRMGGALLASAATSALAGVPILFCTIEVFVRFGTMMILNTALSLLFSMGFLPAALMIAGPLTDPCGDALRKLWRRCRGTSKGTPQPYVSDDSVAPQGVVVGTVVGVGGRLSNPGAAAVVVGSAPASASSSPACGGAGCAWTQFDKGGRRKNPDGPTKDATPVAFEEMAVVEGVAVQVAAPTVRHGGASGSPSGTPSPPARVLGRAGGAPAIPLPIPRPPPLDDL